MCLILRFDRVIFASVWRGALLELDHGSAVMRMLWEEESAPLSAIAMRGASLGLEPDREQDCRQEGGRSGAGVRPSGI